MPYRSTEKTRLKKDAKRTAMMQAAVRVFADKGYHAATVRDIVNEADVAIGTFYFYFPDKETLFVHLFEETAAFLLQAIEQAMNSRTTFPAQLEAAIRHLEVHSLRTAPTNGVEIVTAKRQRHATHGAEQIDRDRIRGRRPVAQHRMFKQQRLATTGHLRDAVGNLGDFEMHLHRRGDAMQFADPVNGCYEVRERVEGHSGNGFG